MNLILSVLSAVTCCCTVSEVLTAATHNPHGVQDQSDVTELDAVSEVQEPQTSPSILSTKDVESLVSSTNAIISQDGTTPNGDFNTRSVAQRSSSVGETFNTTTNISDSDNNAAAEGTTYVSATVPLDTTSSTSDLKLLTTTTTRVPDVTKSHDTITAGLGLNDITTMEGEQASHHMSFETNTHNSLETGNHTNIVTANNSTANDTIPGKHKMLSNLLFKIKYDFGISGVFYVLLIIIYVSSLVLSLMLTKEPVNLKL